MKGQNSNYSCAKCGNHEFDTDEIRTTGEWSRFFDMQNKKFTVLICRQCGYCEFYRTGAKGLGNLLDLLASN